MDLNFLQGRLKEALEQSHLKRNIRYCNIGFSSKNLADLDDITQSLRLLLPGYGLWQTPSMQGAPDLLASRKQLIDQILASKQQGIIIHQPEQWLSQWSLVDKQAFWSALGMSHGHTKVVLSFAESNEFQQINNKYYKLTPLTGLAINLWRPARTE